MCNYYEPADLDLIAEEFAARAKGSTNWPSRFAPVFPRGTGPFIRDRDGAREVVLGQWGLVPWFAKTANLRYSTNNARAEELTAKASYKLPWKKGQRCIIPAASFDEPNWESGRNVWHRFRRVDGRPWGLAGLWNTWVDKATGELLETYTMLTLNADDHPIMRRMHKPDPKLPPDAQDKRSVVPLEAASYERWLTGSMEDAQALFKLPPPETFLVEALEGGRP